MEGVGTVLTNVKDYISNNWYKMFGIALTMTEQMAIGYHPYGLASCHRGFALRLQYNSAGFTAEIGCIQHHHYQIAW